MTKVTDKEGDRHLKLARPPQAAGTQRENDSKLLIKINQHVAKQITPIYSNSSQQQ